MKMLLIILTLVLGLTSCSTRATSPTDFTVDAVLLDEGRVFQREWKKGDFKSYKTICIMPVDTSYLKTLGWWEKMTVSTYDDSDVWPEHDGEAHRYPARQFSRYMNETFRKEFAKNPENKLRFVNYKSRNRETLLVEIALTEMVPIKKFLIGFNLLGDGSLKGGVATIEGRVRNGLTGKVLMSFTDRKVQSSSMISRESGHLYWYSHAKPIIRNWAKMLVTSMNETYLKDKK